MNKKLLKAHVPCLEVWRLVFVLCLEKVNEGQTTQNIGCNFLGVLDLVPISLHLQVAYCLDSFLPIPSASCVFEPINLAS
jgi:hypothetical protein